MKRTMKKECEEECGSNTEGGQHFLTRRTERRLQPHIWLVAKKTARELALLCPLSAGAFSPNHVKGLDRRGNVLSSHKDFVIPGLFEF
jgi:hypothetical protein